MESQAVVRDGEGNLDTRCDPAGALVRDRGELRCDKRDLLSIERALFEESLGRL